ncbi:TfoX/Sxy family protein [Sphingomonas sp. PB2P19]|uniref:TfoX/Sxy family protein n=1 Tax=Sphingomonas rhamnosi TaxID=3096156 RepID=UPI002FC744E4
MSSDPGTVAFIVDQAGGAASGITGRAMFGEYGLYLDGKLVALVCDDQLFVKPTNGGRAYAPDTGTAPPYPGAKPCLVIDAGQLEDREWLGELFRRTAAELPMPKPKNKKKLQPGADRST